MKADWQKIAFVLFGLIVGSGFTGSVSYFQSAEAASERTKIEKKAEEKSAVQTLILIEMGRIGEKVDNLSKEVIRLRDKIKSGD